MLTELLFDILIISLLCFLVGWVVLHFGGKLVNIKHPYASKLAHYRFVFLFFLIGKYYCDIPEREKRVWYIIHKILWFIIIFSVTFNLAQVIAFFTDVE